MQQQRKAIKKKSQRCWSSSNSSPKRQQYNIKYKHIGPRFQVYVVLLNCIKKVWQGKYLSVALSGNEQCCKDFLRATRKIVTVKNAKIVCPLLHHCTRTTKRLSHDETCISSMPSTNGLCFKSLYNVVDNIVVWLCRRTSESLCVCRRFELNSLWLTHLHCFSTGKRNPFFVNFYFIIIRLNTLYPLLLLLLLLLWSNTIFIWLAPSCFLKQNHVPCAPPLIEQRDSTTVWDMTEGDGKGEKLYRHEKLIPLFRMADLTTRSLINVRSLYKSTVAGAAAAKVHQSAQYTSKKL